ncbi:MAG: hypothetical protein BAJALOKI1v1_100019 [Promethearchaeota archaeon]|nr:MAG: hypothetical protein BAJALOKI1v1_100019 [Candidatus Lokiarchaeota archaeon]
MNYCPVCNNLLIPREKCLVCRICEAEFQLVENKDKNTKNLVPLPKNQ